MTIEERVSALEAGQKNLNRRVADHEQDEQLLRVYIDHRLADVPLPVEDRSAAVAVVDTPRVIEAPTERDAILCEFVDMVLKFAAGGPLNMERAATLKRRVLALAGRE